MEPYRFSDFPNTRSGAVKTSRGEWLSESGSLYPTLDIANLVDVICENIRTKAATMTGYKDRDAQVPQLLRLFRLNGGAGPTVSYEEFVNTLAKMNVVGLQHGVSALFDRYDFDGSGAVVVEQFVAMVLKCVPDANGALDLRNGFAAIRRALRASAGVHGVRKLVQALERRAKRGGLLSRSDLPEAIATELQAYVKDTDIRPITSVYDTDKAGVISLPEMIFGLRGPLPRGRRILIDRAWAGILRKAGITTRGLPFAASIDIDTLASSIDTSAPCFHQNSSLHTAGRTMFGGGFSTGGSSARPQTARLYSSRDNNYGNSARGGFGGGDDYDIYSAFPNATEVSFGKFLDYCKDVSAALPRDSEFVKLIQEGFGVADTYIERSSLVKPGSIEDLLRTGRGAHGLPDATAVGRRPVEGLLGKPAAQQDNTRYALTSASRLTASLGGRLNATNGTMVPVDATMGMGVTGTAFGASGAGAAAPIPTHHHQAAAATFGASHGAPFNAYPRPAMMQQQQQDAAAAASPYAASRRPVHGASRPFSAMPALSSSSSPRSMEPAAAASGGLSLGGTSYGQYQQHQQQQQQLPPAAPAVHAAAASHHGGWNEAALSSPGGGSSRAARPMTAMPSLGRSGAPMPSYAAVAAGATHHHQAEPEAAPAAAAAAASSVRWGEGPSSSSSSSSSAAMMTRPPSAPAGRFGGSSTGGALEGLPLGSANYSPSAGSLSGTGGGFGMTAAMMGGQGSPGSAGGSMKQRPQTAGPRVMLAPQLARSLGRNAIRL